MTGVQNSNGLEIGFFNRVSWDKGAHPSESCHGLGRFCEWYFDMGQKRYVVVNEAPIDGSIPVTPAIRKKASCAQVIAKVALCFFKVLTYLTVVMPLIMFVAKCIYRSENSFISVQTQSNQSKDLGGSQDDGVNGNANNKSNAAANNAQDILEKRRKNVQRFLVNEQDPTVDADFSDKKIQERIEDFRHEVENLIIGTTDDLMDLYRLYQKMDSQRKNINNFLGKDNRALLTDDQRTYLSERRDDIQLLIDTLKTRVTQDVIDLFKNNVEEPFAESLNKFDDEKKKCVENQIERIKTLLGQIKLDVDSPAQEAQLKEVDDLIEGEYDKFVEERYQMLDKEQHDRYLALADLMQKLAVQEPDEKVYDEFVFERAKKLSLPVRLRNCGNTCYLNSALQLILTVPELVSDIRNHWKDKLPRLLDESDDRYQIRVKAFDRAHKLFKELTTLLQKKDQKNHQNAVANLLYQLNEAFAASRCFVDILGEGGGHGQEADAIQPIDLFLKNSGYSLKTQKTIRYTHAAPNDDNAANDGEGVENAPQELHYYKCNETHEERFIKLHMKEFVGEELYANTFQDLINHQYSHYKPMGMERIDGIGEVDNTEEIVKLTETKDILVVQLDRAGVYRDPVTGTTQVIERTVVDPETEEEYTVQDMLRGKHHEDIKFADGEIVDFTAVYDSELVKGGEKMLYEVVAVAHHFGGVNGNAHWVADVKSGGQWYRCNDDARLLTHGISNPRLGEGLVYIFKRVK